MNRSITRLDCHTLLLINFGFASEAPFMLLESSRFPAIPFNQPARKQDSRSNECQNVASIWRLPRLSVAAAAAAAAASRSPLSAVPGRVFVASGSRSIKCEERVYGDPSVRFRPLPASRVYTHAAGTPKNRSLRTSGSKLIVAGRMGCEHATGIGKSPRKRGRRPAFLSRALQGNESIWSIE